MANCKNGPAEKHLQSAMGSALDIALRKRNRPAIIDFLINHGAKVDGYSLVPDEEGYREHEKRWIELAKTLPNNILADELKDFLFPNTTESPSSPARKSVQEFNFRQRFEKVRPADIMHRGAEVWMISSCLHRFRGVQRVKEIVGEGFEYTMSAISPEFDLMVLAALRNDR